MRVGIVAIGRNEGERLKACLRSAVREADTVVYVDSGSSDGSQAFAASLGVHVVTLAVPPNFTAARARNAGTDALIAAAPETEFIQFVDGDCVLDPAWIATGAEMLRCDDGLGAVFGRLRELHPERSFYNRLCDYEWAGTPGDAPGFGGIALMRVAALEAAGRYRADMIAGEDTEMAMRMRKAGWRIERSAAAMATHDANITRFRQWWRRARRGGHGFAEMAHLHPDARWPDWPRTCRSIVAWGGVLPAAIVAAAALAAVHDARWGLAALAGLALYPVKASRIAAAERRAGMPPSFARGVGALLMLGKIPEFLGLLSYHRNRTGGRASRIIEYKHVGERAS